MSVHDDLATGPQLLDEEQAFDNSVKVLRFRVELARVIKTLASKTCPCGNEVVHARFRDVGNGVYVLDCECFTGHEHQVVV